MPNRTQAEELAKLPYLVRVNLDRDTDGEPIYAAYIVEMDTCVGQGDTFEEAVADVRLALADFIESLLDHNQVVPGPRLIFHDATVEMPSLRLADIPEKPVAKTMGPVGVFQWVSSR